MPKVTNKLVQSGKAIFGPDPANRKSLIDLTGRRGRHSDGGGLYFVVGHKGEHRWAFLYKSRTRKLASGLPAPVEMGIGGAPDGTGRDAVSLANARKRAKDHRAILHEGKDPLETRRTAKAVPVVIAAPIVAVAPERPADQKNITFGEFADQYFEEKKVGWKNPKHVAQWKRDLQVICEPLRPKMVRDIDTSDVLKLVRPIFEDTPETGKRLQERINRVIGAATVEGYRDNIPSPARWAGHLSESSLRVRKASDVRNHPALPYAEMPIFMGELRQRNSLSALALRFTIGTCARTNEIIGAMWKEIDFDSKTWTIPGARMKGGRDHKVPLTDSMVALLKDVKRISHGDYIFAIGHSAPLSNQAMSELLKGMREPGIATVHGFRSSFRDWAGDEEADIDPTIAEFCLAHVIGDKAEKAYRRGTAFNKRRKALEAWEKYLAG